MTDAMLGKVMARLDRPTQVEMVTISLYTNRGVVSCRIAPSMLQTAPKEVVEDYVAELLARELNQI